jgi:hypothetical protein
MKKLLFLAVMAISAQVVVAQATERKRVSPRQKTENEYVIVTYGSPAKKGRVVFGELEKFGSVWRLGADEATEITFKKDGTFGGQPIKAGTYTMFARIFEDAWEIILNSELKQWGAYGYNKIKDKDVLVVKVPTQKTSEVVENLTISANANDLSIAWDNTLVIIPYEF